MMKIETDLREMQVVDAERLNHLTNRGWRLICVIQEATTQVDYIDRHCPGPPPPGHGQCPHNYSYGHNHSEQVVNQVTTTMFLVGYPEGDAMADMAETLSNAKRLKDIAERDLKEVEGMVENLTTNLKSAEAETMREKEYAEEQIKLRRDAEARARKLESALQEERAKVEKLKAALGEKALE